MASCQPRVPGVRYWDESWWQEFFTKDLAEFYASLNGLLRAREALLKELSGDLAQVLADPQRRDLALRVLFGGLDENCLEKMEQGANIDCITPGKAAHLYKYVLGVGVGKDVSSDLTESRGLLKTLRSMSLDKLAKEKLGLSINDYGSGVMSTITEMKKLTDEVYNKVRQTVQVKQVQTDYGLDLVKAFEDFLNKSVKLLPLYNPFMFFIQSLRSTPRPYLNAMYCDLLFTDPVRSLMSKYGVELTKILEPDLSPQSLNDELAVVGHEDGSVGDLIVKLIQKIYDMTYKLNALGYPVNDELKEYVKAKYEEKAPTGDTIKELVSRADDVFDVNNMKTDYQYCYSVTIYNNRGVLFFRWTYKTIERYHNIIERYEPECSLGSFHFYRPGEGRDVLRGVVRDNVYTNGWGYREYSLNFEGKIAYERFLEVFSPLLFLGIAWIDHGNLCLLYPGDKLGPGS